MISINKKNHIPGFCFLKKNYSKFSYYKNNSSPNSLKPSPLINNNTLKLSGRCALASGIAMALGIGIGNSAVMFFYVLNKSNIEKK